MINIGFYKLKIKLYIPNPIRCRKCLRLGHVADSCGKEPIRGFCGKPQHQGTPCETIVPSCANCKGTHHSLDIKCPKFLEEKEIKTIQFREKVTYAAARKQYKESHNNPLTVSYAEATRKCRKVDVGCQTDACILSRENYTEPAISGLVSGCTGLTPLLSLRSKSPSLPLSSPPLPSPSPSTTPPTASLPKHSPLPIPSGSRDPAPPTIKSGDEVSANFKTPPLPKRNATSRNSKKQNKNETNKTDYDMDTI